MHVHCDECSSAYIQAETQCWSEQMQAEWGDCLGKGFVSVLSKKVNMDLRQNDLSDIMGLWNQMSVDSRKNFSERYGQIASLLYVKIEKQMIYTAIQFWDPSYRCFSFNQIDLTPTLEEYTALLGLELQRPDKVFVKSPEPQYARNLSSILGIRSEDFSAHIKKKGDKKCLTKKFLCDFIQRHLGDEHGLAAFALAIYGLIIFPKVLGHIAVGVIDLFEGIQHHCNPVPAILAETFRALNFCRRTGSGRFLGCQQLLYVWLRSHLDSKQKAFIKPYLIPVQEFCEVEWPIAKSKEDSVSFLKRLSEGQVVWMAPWMPKVSVLFRCGNIPWVPLLGLWGVIGYAPLLVLRQFGANQFVPVTHGLTDLDYEYREPEAFERTKSMIQMWKDTHRMMVGPLDRDKVTPKYEIWRNQRVEDTVGSLECFPDLMSVRPPELALSGADLVMKGLDTQKKECEKEKPELQEMVSQLKNDAMVQERNFSNIKRDRDMVMDVQYDEGRRWSEQMQAELGDCLGKGFVSSLPEKVYLDIQQNDLSDLVGLWNQMSEKSRKNFSEKYGQIASLLFVKIEEQMMHAAIQFWDPSYRCFTFGFNQIDLTPTLEEYTALLGLSLQDPDKIYVRIRKPFRVKRQLSLILGIKQEDLSTHIMKKEDHVCVSKEFLCDFIQGHLGDEHGRAAFALAIYGLIIFPKVMGHVESHVMELFEAHYLHRNPIPAILAETFRSLNFCRRTGSGRFVGCAQLLYVWLRSHLDSKQKAFAEPYLRNHPIQEFCEVEWPIAKSKEDWMSFLQRLSEEQVIWMAPWMPKVSVLFRSGKMPWVPLLGLWGVIEYAPLLVLRQFGATQFVPVTHGLMDEEYAYRESGAFERRNNSLQMWHDTQRMSIKPLADKEKVTLGYEIWRNQRVKDAAVSLVMQGLEAQKKELEEEKSRLQEMVSQLKYDAMVQEINFSNMKRDRDIVNSNLEDLQKENKKLKIQSSEEKELEMECLKEAVEFWKGKAKDNGQKLENELLVQQVLKGKYYRLVHECQFKEEMYSKAVRSMKEHQKRNEELECRLNQN